ncbi:MAG: PaaI family thioesterase [bacterium]
MSDATPRPTDRDALATTRRWIERVAEARRTRAPMLLVAGIPYARFLGVSAELEDEDLIGRLAFSERLIGNPVLPALHGGTVGALLEMTALVTVAWRVEGIGVPKIINLTIDYLRSARPEDVRAQGYVTKQGRRVVNVFVRAWQRDPEQPIASANAHFLVDAPGAGGAPGSE